MACRGPNQISPDRMRVELVIWARGPLMTGGESPSAQFITEIIRTSVAGK